MPLWSLAEYHDKHVENMVNPVVRCLAFGGVQHNGNPIRYPARLADRNDSSRRSIDSTADRCAPIPADPYYADGGHDVARAGVRA